jgi:hypothetical protein
VALGKNVGLKAFSFVVVNMNYHSLIKVSHITVFHIERPDRLVDRNRHFVRICYLHLQENCMIF